MNETIGNYLNERKLNQRGQAILNLDKIVLTRLDRFLNKDFKEANKENIVNFLSTLKVKESSLSIYKSIIKQFYKWLFKSETYPEVVSWIKTTYKKKYLSKSDILSPNEVIKLIDSCDNSRDRCLIALVYESAGRISEILNLKWKDVSFLNNAVRIDIRVSKTTPRTVLVVESKNYIEAWKKETKYPNFDDWVFVSMGKNKGSHIKALNCDTLIRHLAIKAGISKRVYMHLLRHSRLTETAKFLTDAEQKVFAGWTAGSNMNRIYTHLSEEDVERKILANHGLASNAIEIKPISPINCSNCYELNSNDRKFCAKCGYPLTEEGIMKSQKELTEIKEIKKELLDKYKQVEDLLSKFAESANTL